MKIIQRLRYHWNVNVLGFVYRIIQKRAKKQRARNPSRWDTEILAPPLEVAEKSKMMVAKHLLRGRHANERGKVAWVTSGAPVEILKALDFYVFYPENHGAICGTARVVEEISSEAEAAGYSRDICSYARTDIGTMLSGKTPLRNLPKPDLLLACTNICQTVLHWFRVLAFHYKVPLVLIDAPFVFTEAFPHTVAYVRRQIEEAIPIAEKVVGKSLDESRLHQVTTLSRNASQLWMEILDRCQHIPAPISAFDQFILMAPIVEMRGEVETVDFYEEMLKEVDDRILNGIGAVKNEKKRLLWDNLPIWYRLRYLAEFLGKHGIVLAASTYTNAWGELARFFDPSNPFESAARTYLHPILNQGTGEKLSKMKTMIEDYHLDGVILHSDRSCKPYSIGQMDQRDRLIREHEVPTLLLEADHNDPRSFSEKQVATRLGAFVEMLGV
jgi:benzoyl-CoA reductase/2-hydroxyglutaryl-CoA dehydratase subunit BcrC/BadD/HgdB